MTSTLTSLPNETTFKELLTKRPHHHFLIYKHSTICSVSLSAKSEVSCYAETANALPIYELEVRDQRPLANLISTTLAIKHESPQIILIKNGHHPVWHCSHFKITQENIESAIIEHHCQAR